MLVVRGRAPQGRTYACRRYSRLFTERFRPPATGRRAGRAAARPPISDHEGGVVFARMLRLVEILRVTNSSGGDLALVFERAIIEKATCLCSASYGYIWTYDGESARAVAVHGDARFEEWLPQRDPVLAQPAHPVGAQNLLSRRLAHVVDAKEDETYRNDPRFRDLVDRAGLRTLLHVPLRKGDTLLPQCHHCLPLENASSFTDQQILVAGELRRAGGNRHGERALLDEQRDAAAALDQQTATAEVLRVISAAPPTDVQPVLKAVAAARRLLCAAEDADITLREGSETGDGRSCRRKDHKRTEGQYTHAARPNYHQRPVDHGRRHRSHTRCPCA